MRLFPLLAGLLGGAGLSQAPEFAQQYTQRLGGAVDELRRMAAGFDADAAGLGLTRTEALAQLQTGGDMAAAQAARMQGAFDRLARLAADLERFQEARGLEWLLSAHRLSDPEIAEAAWAVFKPALPLTGEGLVCAALGLCLGYGVWRGGAVLLRAGFRALGGGQGRASA